MRREFAIEEEWIGFELHPETPPEGVPVRDVLPEGTDIEAVFRQFNDHGRPYGLDFKVNEIMPNTRLALEAGEFARAQGLFDAFHGLVFQKYFTEGKDIGRVPVLLEIAGELGLDPRALQRALEAGAYTPAVAENRRRAQADEVWVLPTFFIGDTRIAGIRDYAYFQRVLRSAPG